MFDLQRRMTDFLRSLATEILLEGKPPDFLKTWGQVQKIVGKKGEGIFSSLFPGNSFSEDFFRRQFNALVYLVIGGTDPDVARGTVFGPLNSDLSRLGRVCCYALLPHAFRAVVVGQRDVLDSRQFVTPETWYQWRLPSNSHSFRLQRVSCISVQDIDDWVSFVISQGCTPVVIAVPSAERTPSQKSSARTVEIVQYTSREGDLKNLKVSNVPNDGQQKFFDVYGALDKEMVESIRDLVELRHG